MSFFDHKWFLNDLYQAFISNLIISTNDMREEREVALT